MRCLVRRQKSATVASVTLLFLVTSGTALGQEVRADDCSVWSTALDSLALGHHIVVSSTVSTDYDSEWRNSASYLAQAFDGAFGNWLERSRIGTMVPQDCIQTRRPSAIVSVTNRLRVVADSDTSRLTEAFPGTAAIAYLTLPGYNARRDTAFVEVSQLCVAAECGASWMVVFSKKSSWQIEWVSADFKY